jgi:hypothetical protein
MLFNCYLCHELSALMTSIATSCKSENEDRPPAVLCRSWRFVSEKECLLWWRHHQGERICC